jgi:hypothetical protein
MSDMFNPNRVPEGVSTGGEFAPELKGEPPALRDRAAATAEPRRAPQTPAQKMVDRLRGHKFYPPKAQLSKFPPVGTNDETPLEEIEIHGHYFTRGGAANWYVAEYDPATGHAWGYADITGSTGEWGSFDMVELEQLHVGWTVIERDCHFSKGPFAKVAKQ